MTTHNRPFVLAALLTILLLGTAVQARSQDRILQEGLTAFQQSDFGTAIMRFREVLLESPDEQTEATAYFWLAKSAMAAGRLAEAERNLEFYLLTFPNHRFYVEGRYQQGRLLFMQQDYESAIQSLEAFIRDFPDSPFVANAVYWSGEALFSLGRLDQARLLFQRVIRDFPSSFRVEAARYRVAVIELTFREQELLQLLRWSHEENLRALDEFRRRERAFQEAITVYQERLASNEGQTGQDEINRLTSQNRSLQETLRNRDARLRQLEDELRELSAGRNP